MPDIAQILRFRSTDAAEVADTWKAFAPTSELLQVDETRCRLDWVSVSVPGLSLITYELAADVRSSIEPIDQLFTCRVTTRTGGSESSRRALDPALPWASDGHAIHARWEDTATVHAMVFDREHAERLARQMSGDDTLSVRVRRPEALSREAAKQWDLAFRYLSTSLAAEHPTVGESALTAAGLQRHALWTALTTFSTTFADAMRRSAQTMSAPKIVRRALSYIETHAHLPITLEDIAGAAHISTRGLQYAFRRSLDFTPSEYLRRVRLSAAREELLSAPAGTALADIAQRWGFSNISRFTAAYRAEYGEHPAVALRRGC